MWGSGVTALPRAVGEGGWRSWPAVGGVTGEVVCVRVCARACVCRECGVGGGSPRRRLAAYAQAQASRRAGGLEGGGQGAGAVGRPEGLRADARWGGRGTASASRGAGDSRPTHPRVRAPAACPRSRGVTRARSRVSGRAVRSAGRLEGVGGGETTGMVGGVRRRRLRSEPGGAVCM